MGSSKVVRLPNTGNAIKAYFPGVFILMQSAVGRLWTEDCKQTADCRLKTVD